MALMDILAAYGGATPGGGDALLPLDTLWQYVTTLGLVESLTFISFGVVWLFHGWRVFKILVTICFSVLGLVVGIWVHRELVGGEVVWLSLLFMLLFGFLAVWLMTWAVRSLGGVAGAVLAAGVWVACGFPDRLLWAGAVLGFAGGAMMSFIVFQGAIMLFTSLGGSLLTTTGLLAILYRYVEDGARLAQTVTNDRWFVPVMVTVPTAIGMVVQYRLRRGSEEGGA